MMIVSLNWASIAGLLLIALWCPALVVSLRRFDALMRRDASSGAIQGLGFGLFLINLAGRTISLPLAAFMLFFQGWRLDPILQLCLGLLVLGMLFESIRSIRADALELHRHHPFDATLSVRQRALERRLQDRVWPWAIAHITIPFAGIYYAMTRRTITPLLWDVLSRLVVVVLTAGLLALISVLFPLNTDRVMTNSLTDADWVHVWIQAITGLLLLVVNLVAAVLPVRAAIRRTQTDARRRLDAHG